jgi:sugar-specific transcriptional regulator TrmB
MAAKVVGMDGARGIEAGPLALLGIGDVEQRVYRALLARHQAVAAVIADDLGISPDDATELLAHLESLGLGTRLPGTPETYAAVEPELAIDALIKRRQHTLEQARKAVPVLAKTFAQAAVEHPDQQPVIESVANRAHLHHVLAQLNQSSRTDLMVFQKGPVIVAGDEFIGDTVTEARVRTVSDESYLAAPGGLEGLHKDMARGEQQRTFSRLPFKMVIADKRTALINLDAQDPDAPKILIHRSTLLEALCLLFEFVWEKATPVIAARDGEVKVRSESAGHGIESAKALLPLLSAGLNDKAIAQELDISASTLNRRIGDLMSIYNARTRFQLGLQVARLNDAA